MSFTCLNCKKITDGPFSSQGRLYCEVCLLKQNTFKKTEVGIHPALAKRYQPKNKLESPKTAQAIKEHPEDSSEFPVIPGYQLLGCIGKGAMGKVYHAIHRHSQKEAAIKVLSDEFAKRPDLSARFEREIAALRSFRHENAITIFDSGTTQRVKYYAMEYIKGVTLRKCLKEGPLPPLIAIAYLKQILSGIGAAHARGIIHRDLKPENVLVDKAHTEKGISRLVLVDFGLADILNETHDPHPNLTKSRVTMGTVNYMAPEQHTDAKRVDKRTDLYACGVILYECLTGDLPLGRYLLPTERGIEAPKSLDICILKALNQKAEERFQSAEEFTQALQEAERDFSKAFTPSETYKTQKPSPPVSAHPSMGQDSILYQSVLSSIFTHASQMPLLNKAKLYTFKLAQLPYSWLFLFTLLSGIILSSTFLKKTVKEIVVSQESAYAIFHQSRFHDSNNREWVGDSPVWQLENPDKIKYNAKQGEALHLRLDFSFLKNNRYLSSLAFGTQGTLQNFQVRLDPTKTQHQARSLLGSTPEGGAIGVFLLSKKEDRAFGTLVMADGTWGVAELKQENNLYRVVQITRMKLKHSPFSQSFQLSISCNGKTSQCMGSIGALEHTRLHIPTPFEDTSFIPTLGCRNAICMFHVPSL